jgi:hypothetical protein
VREVASSNLAVPTIFFNRQNAMKNFPPFAKIAKDGLLARRAVYPEDFRPKGKCPARVGAQGIL